MDEGLARKILLDCLRPFRDKDYSELVSMVGECVRPEVPDPWQVKVQFYWDGGDEGGDVRAFGSIDDGGVRAWEPLVECFIMNPAGGFVDE